VRYRHASTAHAAAFTIDAHGGDCVTRRSSPTRKDRAAHRPDAPTRAAVAAVHSGDPG
jgi:hypothetical protein